MARGGVRHRFELTRLEIAGVVVSAAAGFLVVFLLGVYAGRGLDERRLEDPERLVRLPVEDAGDQPPARADELTFDRTLSGGERGKAADEAGARLAMAQPTPTAPPERLTVLAAERRGAGPALGAAEPPAAPDRVPGRIEPTPAARVAVAVVAAPNAPAPGVRGAWTVQVMATRDRATADDMLRRLKAKGYDAYIVPVTRQGETFHRVRVGRYPSIERANQMVSRLRREPGVPEVFVASD